MCRDEVSQSLSGIVTLATSQDSQQMVSVSVRLDGGAGFDPIILNTCIKSILSIVVRRRMRLVVTAMQL